ncbi:MAG: methyl-accepting chemotaxis protein [Cellulosilyticum sp.]|nr:methyl-accepting chemotaxis protein [Cellulosilyticum sp.]
MKRTKGKLQTKLVAIFLLISIIPAIIIMFMSIVFTTNSTKQLVSVYTQQIVEQLDYNINEYVEIARGAIGDILGSEHVKSAISRYHTLDAAEQSKLRGNIDTKVLSIMNTQDMISGVYVCSNGEICYKNVKIKDTFDIKAFEASDAYIELQEQASTSCNWFYTRDDQETRVYLSRRSATNNRGYIVLMMDLEKLTKLLQLANVETCMSIVVVDENNEIITSAAPEVEIESALLNQIASLDVGANGETIDNNMVSMIELSNGWKAISVAPISSLMMGFNKSCKAIVVALGFLIVCTAILSIVIGRRITKPITSMAIYMKKVQDGNLEIGNQITKAIKASNIEIEQLVNGFVNMIQSLAQMIRTSQNVMAIAKANTNELKQQAETTNQSAVGISETTETITQGTLRQRDAMEEAVSLMGDLSQHVNCVNDIIEKIRVNSRQTMNVSEETRGKLAELYNQSERNIQISSEISESVQELGDETESINKILEMIQGINKQTNLLAINASIESVRAGEHGKGFMVVAEEVRKLSIETEEAIKQIVGVVEIIEEKRKATLTKVSEAVSVFNKQLPLVDTVNDTFSNIYHKMNGIDGQINEANALILTVSQKKQNIEQKLKDIMQIAEEFACIIEEVNAETIEQVEAADRISKLSMQLLQVVTSLEACYQCDRTIDNGI